ncbi:MAG TPA: hypothetical protein VMW62_06320 [Chloroflexota bacterium]|nr:hypothetical protein [Chloroflexota bacterium]
MLPGGEHEFSPRGDKTIPSSGAAVYAEAGKPSIINDIDLRDPGPGDLVDLQGEPGGDEVLEILEHSVISAVN